MGNTFLSKNYYKLLMAGTLQMMVVVALLMSDTLIAGAFLGEDAVAGINLITPVYSLAAFFGSVFAIGLPILYSNAMGRFDEEEADRLFGFGVIIASAIGILLFIIVMLGGDLWLDAFHPADAVRSQAEPYFFWYKFVILLLPLSLVIEGMVLADGDELISTVSSLAQVLANIVCSLVLCEIIGIAGVGIGTLVGTSLSCLLTLLHFRRPQNSLHFKAHFSWKTVLNVGKYSVIDASSYLFIAIFGATMNVYVSRTFGPDALILVSLTLFIKELQMVFDGIGEAITPIIGVYLGEGSYDGVRNCWRIARNTAIIEGIILTVLMLLLAHLLVQIFGVENPEMAEYAVSGTRVMALSLPFLSLLYLMTSYYLVREKIVLGVVICALRDVLASIPLAMLMGRMIGISGLFDGTALAPLLAYVLSVLIVIRKYGKEDYPLLLQDLEKDQVTGFYEFTLSPEEIVQVERETAKLPNPGGLSQLTVGKAGIIIEDVFMLVLEKNPDRLVHAECTVKMEEDGVRIVTKDDGVLFDLSEEDVLTRSITGYMVSEYMESMGNDKHNLITMSNNRNTFFVREKEA